MANQGGSSCRLRYHCAEILVRRICAVWRGRRKTAPQARRLLALAAIYDGATRTEAAKIGGVGLQIIRDWVLHFNERGPDGLLNGKSPGQPSKLNDVQRQAIARMIESGPFRQSSSMVPARLTISASNGSSGVPHPRSPSRRQPGSCAPGLSQARPNGRAITPSRGRDVDDSKKLPRAPGRNRA